MKILLLTVKLVLSAYLVYLLIFLATDYHPALPGYSPPFIIFVIDTINLFIHEAGHFFFRLFGVWLHIIAGSLVQVLIPCVLLVVTWRQRISQITLPGFWTGESMANISVYIRDAPHKQLRLITRGLIHDWNWLLSDSLDAAEPLADIVLGVGLLVCASAIAAGVYFAFRTYREQETITTTD